MGDGRPVRDRGDDGTVVSILLFALTSFLALREFVTLAPTKPEIIARSSGPSSW